MSTEYDAFRQPQLIRPGCQHQMGCKCAPPYYLRTSSAIEILREVSLHDATTVVRGIRVQNLQGNRSDLATAIAEIETTAVVSVRVL